jgi:hypothetical protein
MVTPVTRIGGVVDEWAARTARQLDADTPYSVSLLAQDVVLDPAARRACDDYCGDLSGRYLEAAALTRLLGRDVDWAKAQRVARTVLGAQLPNGGFGPANRPGGTTDHGVAWGNGRLLAGLITFADAADEPLRGELESAAARLVEHLVGATPAWLDWIADPQNRKLKFALDFLSTLDPLVSWYRRTLDERALHAVRAMANVIPPPSGDFHLHGYLLALRGWLEYADVVADRSAVDTIYDHWNLVRNGWVLPHGGVLESLKSPRDVSTEGCGIADWIMLSMRLSALLGDTAILDTAEISLYNALPHVQRPSGHYGCETLCADHGLLTFDYAPEAWWCCTLHGLRALYAAALAAVRPVGGGLQVDLYIETTGPNYELRTDYPRSGAVTLTTSAADFVRLRIPSTSILTRLEVNGAEQIPEIRRGCLEIPTAGETTITLELERAFWISSGAVRFMTPTANCTDETGPLHGRRGAIFHGPVLLAADAHRNSLEDVLRSRKAEIRVHGDRFALDDGYRTTGIGYMQRFPLVLAPLWEQTTYNADITSRIAFDQIVARDYTSGKAGPE